jgi:hypothetical protein
MSQVISAQNFHVSEQNGYASPVTKEVSLVNRFLNWCQDQEDKRFLWLAIAILGNIGMVLPITLAAILLSSGSNFALLITVCVVNVPVLALNLAAQPPKVTLPFLFMAWLVDALIILYCMLSFIWIY